MTGSYLKMEKTRILVIKFKNEIVHREIPLFRGAVINTLGEKCDLLFHNHDESKLRYSYPLIQYKCIDQKAALVCINEGADSIGKFFAGANLNLRLGNRMVLFDVENIKADQFHIQIQDTKIRYHISKWLPLNQNNHEQFNQLVGLGDKCHFLERVLVGNVLSFAKGLGIHFEKEVKCLILELGEPKIQLFKGIKMMCYDVLFECNVSLPNAIGLGKGSSINHGTIFRMSNKKDDL